MAPGLGILGWTSEHKAGDTWLPALGTPWALMHKPNWDPASTQPLSVWLPALLRHLETLSKTAPSASMVHLKGQATPWKEAGRGRGASLVSLMKLALIAAGSTYFPLRQA